MGMCGIGACSGMRDGVMCGKLVYCVGEGLSEVGLDGDRSILGV